jgi:parallel beta-helix repeat protein
VRKPALRVERIRLLSAMIALVLCLPAMIVLSASSVPEMTDTAVRDGPNGDGSIPMKTLASAMHDPILIDGDSEFTGPNASTGVTRGSGTASDPYVIEGWEIGSFPSSGVEIRNADVFFVIQDCYVHDGTGWGAAIYLWSCSNGMIRDCAGSSNSYFGIYLDSSSANTLINNTCSNNWYGIRLYSSSSNTLNNNNCSNSGYGMCLESSSNNTLSNNNGSNICLYSSSSNTLSNNNCSSIYEGMHIESSSNNTLINNTCSSKVYFGIRLCLSSSNNTLINNTCSNNGCGIYLEESSRNTISNNTCSNNDVGIYLDRSSYDNILHNNFSDNTLDGMYLNRSGGNTVSNNTCLNNENGIRLNYTDGNSLIGNSCSSNNWSGIYLISSSSNNLTSNNCSSNGWCGIYFTSLKFPPPDVLTHNRLTNNTCIANNVNGIYLTFSDSNELVNNTCSFNAEGGISLAYSSSNNLTGNTCSNNGKGLSIGSGFYNMVQMNRVENNTGWGIWTCGGNGKFWNNTLINNNGAGSVYDSSHVQASDRGLGGNSWSVDVYGNYWSDWTAPDLDGDGIVDWPYVGDGNAYDDYPRTDVQTTIPEFGMMPFVVMALLAAIVLTIGARRRKT